MGRKPHMQLIESEYIQPAPGCIFHWDQSFVKDHRYTTIPVTCGICGETRPVLRLTIVQAIRKKKIVTGLCRSCTGKVNPPPLPKPGYKKGFKKVEDRVYKRTAHGAYITLVISGLNEEDQLLCKGMEQKNTGSPRVLEHRLVMARHIGRPLQKDETVHHQNEPSTDNRIENLRLYVGKHGKGFDGYYQELQEALKEIRDLKHLLGIT